ncbi:MAG TPA: 2-phospho-L-lactate transferase CofD family protein, partial [Ilumatobacter sp.]|nr:2-phospho-L-lactate transferase CofD family protein [Ilumatobacter sp.]
MSGFVDPSHVTVLAGGVGAARFLRGLIAAIDPDRVTAVVNTGDDTELHGLAISPDIDTIVYTLAGAIDPERGWGLAGESWQAMAALERYGPSRPAGSAAGATWFRLGDRDLATHITRTARLRNGGRLTDVCRALQASLGVAATILPMTDDHVRTEVRVDEGWIEFQDYFVARRQEPEVRDIRFRGVDKAHASNEARDALTHASLVVIAPSNPLVSINPI